jgi:hypothetical protein
MSVVPMAGNAHPKSVRCGGFHYIPVQYIYFGKSDTRLLVKKGILFISPGNVSCQRCERRREYFLSHYHRHAEMNRKSDDFRNLAGDEEG